MLNKHAAAVYDAMRSVEAGKMRGLLYPDEYDSDGFRLPETTARDAKGQFLPQPHVPPVDPRAGGLMQDLSG